MFSFPILLVVILSSAQAAIVFPQRTFSPTFFATTYWHGANDIRVYFPSSGSIQELSLDITSQPNTTSWSSHPLIIAPDFAINNDSPIASASTNDAIHLYMYDKTGILRDRIFNGTMWTTGDLAVNLTASGWGSKLAASSWVDSHGNQSFSVWYTDAAGGLYEAYKIGTSNWEVVVVGHSPGPGGIWGTVWVENGKVMKRLYHQDGMIDQHFRESRWDVKDEPLNHWPPTLGEMPSYWSTATVNGFPYHATAPTSFTAVTMPSDQTERVLVNPATTAIWSYTRAGPQNSLWDETPVVTAAKTRVTSGMSATAVRFGDEDQVHLVYVGLDGRLEHTAYSSRSGWATDHPVITV